MEALVALLASYVAWVFCVDRRLLEEYVLRFFPALLLLIASVPYVLPLAYVLMVLLSVVL